MTKPSLISARPWNDEDARAGLVERATTASGSLDGRSVAITVEPHGGSDQPTTTPIVTVDPAAV